MDGIGCRWTVWEGNGKTPGLAAKGVGRPEDGCPGRNDRASALARPCITDPEQEAIMFRQAITRTDWDTVEGHGGFDVVMEKVVH